jgi:uncharacterized protein YdaU (DUF1376 family)
MNTDTKRKPLYQPWSEEEFRADVYVYAMTPVQRWMYRTLLQAAFFCSTRPNLPNDDSMLWMLAGCESRKQWEENKEVVRAMFTPIEHDGVALLGQKRVLADWGRLEEKRQAYSEAGRRGGKTTAAQMQARLKPGSGQAQARLKQEKLREVKIR